MGLDGGMGGAGWWDGWGWMVGWVRRDGKMSKAG